jgi:REP-associated tyrosine transposase
MRILTKPGDYAAFQQIMLEAHEKHPVRILGYCLMPTHWHLVVWPRQDGELSRFMHWLTMTHTLRWRHYRGLVGLGPLYQGRFKAFPIQTDSHLLAVLRYVERNAMRANLVARAQDWRHSSLYDRLHAASPMQAMLHEWPIEMPRRYVDLVNRPQSALEEEAMLTSIKRGRPFGDATWQEQLIERLGLESSVNPPHRPRRAPDPRREPGTG